MAQQTAVEWYADELLGLMLELATNTISESEYHIKRKKAFEQAKEIEKDQIMDGFINGDKTDCMEHEDICVYAEQYYNETYERKS